MKTLNLTLMAFFFAVSFSGSVSQAKSKKSETTPSASSESSKKDTATDTKAKKDDSKTAKKDDKKNPVIIITTNKGKIEAELNAEKAPISVKNFLEYVAKKQYDGTIFHRVIPGFMIQGGGFDKNMKEKPTGTPIKNEAGNGLKNLVGTLAMARTGIVDSATAQFFINVKDNDFLDHRDETQRGFGYAVFGKVTSGMDVVTTIEKVPTVNQGMFENVPMEAVVIESIQLKK